MRPDPRESNMQEHALALALSLSLSRTTCVHCLMCNPTRHWYTCNQLHRTLIAIVIRPSAQWRYIYILYPYVTCAYESRLPLAAACFSTYRRCNKRIAEITMNPAYTPAAIQHCMATLWVSSISTWSPTTPRYLSSTSAPTTISISTPQVEKIKQHHEHLWPQGLVNAMVLKFAATDALPHVPCVDTTA